MDALLQQHIPQIQQLMRCSEDFLRITQIDFDCFAGDNTGKGVEKHGCALLQQYFPQIQQLMRRSEDFLRITQIDLDWFAGDNTGKGVESKSSATNLTY
ncbi:MAG: hypothetical protein M3342_17800 [Bacteroidota bacterium]|nr:hypothetical protein [Bacteroidota bacterium]